MNDKSRSREYLRLICAIFVSCVIGALLAAVAAAVILRYVAVEAPSKRYDEVSEILAEYDPVDFRGVTIAADGSLQVRLEKDDIYWYASEYGILQRFEQRLDALADTSGWEIRRYGFHIEDDQVILHLFAARRLPAYFRVVFDVECQGTVLYLQPEEVAISGYLELDPRHWPSLLPREGFRLDFAGMDISGCLRSVCVGDKAIVLESDGLTQALSGQLRLDMSLLRALETYGCEKVDRLGIFDWALKLGTDKVPMAEAHDRVLNSGNAADAMADLLSCCTDSSRMEVLGGWDRFTLEFAGMSVQNAAMDRRQALQRYIAAEQWKYEKLLTSIREMYKAGALSVNETGFSMTQSGALLDHTNFSGNLSITTLDSRPVLLYTERGGATCIRTTDMPPLGTVPRVNERSVKHLEQDRIYDIGMLLTTENDVMALVHYRNDGAFVLREVPEGLYTQVLLSRALPTLCIDALYAPEDRTPSQAASPTSNYEIIFLP